MNSRREDSPEGLAEELNALFVGRCHTGLTACAPVVAEDGSWEMLVESDTVLARQAFLLTLRDEAVRDHLLAWPANKVAISVVGLGAGRPELVCLIEAAAILVVSREPAFSHERLTRKGSFAQWFERLFEAAPPVSIRLEERQLNVWGCPATAGRQIDGFPHKMRIAGLPSYALAGYGGYGVNSYAFYFTRCSGETQMFLRLPYGGAYGDPQQDRLALLNTLSESDRLFRIAAAKRLPLDLWNNMGEVYFSEYPVEQRQSSRWRSMAEVRAYIESAPDLEHGRP